MALSVMQGQLYDAEQIMSQKCASVNFFHLHVTAKSIQQVKGVQTGEELCYLQIFVRQC